MPDPQKNPLAARIGILGGGQLGAMLLQAALDWNLDVAIMDPDPNCPCARYASRFVCGDITDADQVIAFGKQLDLITIEIENVSVAGLKALEAQGKQVYPQPRVVEVIGDKYRQKQFYAQHSIPTSPFGLYDPELGLTAYTDLLPAAQKLNTGGYDGRGVQLIYSTEESNLLTGNSFLEKMVDLEREVAVIVARRQDGKMCFYDPVEGEFHPNANMVDAVRCPAQLTVNQVLEAQQLAGRVADALDITGLLAVELFLDTQGNWLVNECAPRPHNTGHHTIEACLTSQYQQHWRALLGLPLGPTALRCPQAAMLNLVSAEGHTGPAYYQGLDAVLGMPSVFVHLYGKASTRPFRKMGHVTIIGENRAEVDEKLTRIRTNLLVISQK